THFLKQCPGAHRRSDMSSRLAKYPLCGASNAHVVEHIFRPERGIVCASRVSGRALGGHKLAVDRKPGKHAGAKIIRMRDPAAPKEFALASSVSQGARAWGPGNFLHASQEFLFSGRHATFQLGGVTSHSRSPRGRSAGASRGTG